MRDNCFLVVCYDSESCALEPSSLLSGMRLAAAFVVKSKKVKLKGASQMSALPVYDEIGMMYQPGYNRKIQSGLLNDARRNEDVNPYLQAKYYEPATPYEYLSYSNFEKARPRKNFAGYNRGSPTTHIHSHKTEENSDKLPDCIPGPDRYFTTVRGGLNHVFVTDVGIVTSMKSCKEFCCQKSDCDVALLQDQRCLLVSCIKRELCEDIPSRDIRGIARLSHITRRKRSLQSNKNVRTRGTYLRDDEVKNNWRERLRYGNENVQNKIVNDNNYLETKEDNDDFSSERKNTKLNGDRDISTPSQLLEPNGGDMKVIMKGNNDLKNENYLSKENNELKSLTKSPSPVFQSDLDSLVEGRNYQPLIYDDSSEKRKLNTKSKDLNDIVSDILSNILKQRKQNSIESIWSPSKYDPLQNEINKVRLSKNRENIEKELEHFPASKQNSVPSHRKGEKHEFNVGNIANNHSKKNSDLDPQSKMIQFLFDLLKENGTHVDFKKQKEFMGDSANEAVKSSLTTQMQSKITTNSNLNNNRNSYNVVDERNNGIHHRRNQLKSIYSNQLQGYYPTGDQHRRKIYRNEIIATNNEQIPFLNDKSNSEISAQKILNKLKRPFGQEDVDSILDQNIERIIEEIVHQRRNDVDIDNLSENYEDNAPKTLSFQNKQQKLFPKKVYPFNQFEKYHNNISARINSHEKTLWRNLFKKGKSIVEQKQPATLDIMSELEKIEDELANINNQERKDQEIFERKILTPQSTFGYKKYLKVVNRGNKKNKQNMGSKSVPELQQRKRSNTSNSASKIGNKNVILKELNEIKDELGNISTISLKKKGKSQTPIMLDVGDKISNALEKDWDLDKRSRIPKPRENWNALHYWRKSVRNPRSKGTILVFNHFVKCS